MNKAYVLSILIACMLAITVKQQYIDQYAQHSDCSSKVQSLETSRTSLERTVTVTNNITKEMLTYRKRLIPYTPNFSLDVNNHPLKTGESQAICITENQLYVRYTYNFLRGYKTGTKMITFQLPDNMTSCSITFNWDQESRIVIKDAQLINITGLT